MEPECEIKLESNRMTQRPLLVNNVARRLQRSERRVRQLAEAGDIPAFKIEGKSWGFRPSDVDIYKQLLEARDADHW